MTRRWAAFVTLGAVFSLAGTAAIQGAPPPTPASTIPAGQARISPHETISGNFGGSRVVIVYGRPYSKDPKAPTTIRKIWGTLVPWDKVWRMGSDEATLLITQQPLMFGDTLVPAGAYSLDMLPTENGASKFIINKAIGQWGIPYSDAIQKQELARIDMKKEALPVQVDEFTMTVGADAGAGANAGIIKLQWEKTQYSVTFTVKK